MEKISPEDLLQIFLDLQEAELDAVIVGGQAVNLWANHYSDRAPELAAYLPFASEDLDYYGGRVEAVTCHDALGGTLFLNRDFDPSPNAGLVLVDREVGQLRIDFLASIFGLNDAEIVGTAQPFVGKGKLLGMQAKVLHPLLCLEGKLSCLRGLPQSDRQDLKHVSISIYCVRELLRSVCANDHPRPGLKLTERVLEDALREDALSTWFRYGVHVESAVPIDTIQQFSDERWQRFLKIRYPQRLEQIQAKRSRYGQIMERIEARKL